MLKAKALQEKAPTTVGQFKHQAVPKEKLSKGERRRRALERLAKDKESKSGKSASKPISEKGEDGAKSSLAAARRTPEAPVYKGTARPTQSLAPPSQLEYRGTAGLPSRHGQSVRKGQPPRAKRSRNDEYLGTDEEDEGDYGDEQDDYYSESSADMEAGMEDVEEEEEKALSAARKEDEREWRAELAAKKEKMERKRKLTALAAAKNGKK